jgi:hypothetical protein
MMMEEKYLTENGFSEEEVDLMLDLTYLPKSLSPEQTQKAQALYKRSRDLDKE